MRENQDFWQKIPSGNEDDPATTTKRILDEVGPMGYGKPSLTPPVYEKTSENEYNPNYQYLEKEVEFEATFSFAYDNCPNNRITRTKIICTTTTTTEQGRENVRIKLLKSYPNLSINSIIQGSI